MKEPFLDSHKLYQLWRFIVLNTKILGGVIHSKRLSRFLIKYKVSYVVIDDERPNAIANTRKPPQIGDIMKICNDNFQVVEVKQLMPPRGEFCFLQADCKWVGPA